jgi:CubicO group peptidase (beta-lactamase class C family)
MRPAVLGKLIERASGVPYQSYVETRVVAPVRIRGRLGFTIPDLSQHATGYHPNLGLGSVVVSNFSGFSDRRLLDRLDNVAISAVR